MGRPAWGKGARDCSFLSSSDWRETRGGGGGGWIGWETAKIDGCETGECGRRGGCARCWGWRWLGYATHKVQSQSLGVGQREVGTIGPGKADGVGRGLDGDKVRGMEREEGCGCWLRVLEQLRNGQASEIGTTIFQNDAEVNFMESNVIWCSKLL